MSWTRRHELMDLDLDAYEEDAADAAEATRPAVHSPERPFELQGASLLDAAERAGMPLDPLLPKLERGG